MKKTLIVISILLAFSSVCFAEGGGWSKYCSITDVCAANGVAATFIGMDGCPDFDGQIPVIRAANVTSDLATSRLYTLVETGDSTTLSAAEVAAETNLPVTDGTDFDGTTAGAGAFIAIVDYTNKKFEINRISSKSSTTYLELIRDTKHAYASGSTVYELEVLSSSLIGNTTKDWFTYTSYGKSGSVIGFYIDGTSACNIGHGAIEYVHD